MLDVSQGLGLAWAHSERGLVHASRVIIWVKRNQRTPDLQATIASANACADEVVHEYPQS